MLGKTAAHIFWMFRYLERCENTARLINASHFISLTQKQNIANHWDSILSVAGNKKTSGEVISISKKMLQGLGVDENRLNEAP